MRNRLVTLGVLGLGFVYACGSSNDGSSGAAGAGGVGGSGGDHQVGGQPSAGKGGNASAGKGAVNNGGTADQAGETGGGTGGTAGQAGEATGGTSSGGTSGGTAGSAGAGGGGTGGGGAGGSAGTSGSGGAMSAAGEGGEAGAPPVAPVVLDLVDLANTHFLDYGKLRVAFKQAVSAASIQLSLAPSSPSRLAVTQLTQVDASTVDATLAFYHLPIDYTVSVSGTLPDSTLFVTSAKIPGLNNGARLAFLTKQTGSGNLSSWPKAKAGTTGNAAGDSICQSEADNAGYKGTFVALLSARGAYDAGCRALGLTGLLASNCGKPTLPTDTAPWLSTSGMPIVNGATNIIADNFMTPFSNFSDGTVGSQAGAWLGTYAGAKADAGGGTDNSDCLGWTSTTSYASLAYFESDFLIQYADGSSICDVGESLICLQEGGTFFGQNTLHEVSGKRAFVSKGTLTGAMTYNTKTGVAAADLMCQTEASAAGLANSANFYAYLGSSTSDALCHVLGSPGTIGTKCGLGALPAVSWSRTDGYPIATASALMSGVLTAPLSLAADQSPQVKAEPWTGAYFNGGATSNCADWSDTTVNGGTGSPRANNSGWQYYSTIPCTYAMPVNCFER